MIMIDTREPQVHVHVDRAVDAAGEPMPIDTWTAATECGWRNWGTAYVHPQWLTTDEGLQSIIMGALTVVGCPDGPYRVWLHRHGEEGGVVGGAVLVWQAGEVTSAELYRVKPRGDGATTR